MGKWTVGYHDDVLGTKMKSLVAGALKRSKIEKIEPTISYETFVEELDGGDSFTTSLIDALVKELAERRTRQSTADRRLIADRTAKSLRLLALPGNIYRDRTVGRALRRVNLTDYLTSPPEEMDMEEDEGDEGYDGITGENGPSFIEGARVNSDLYDAYAAHGWSAHPVGTSLSRRSHASFSAAFSPPSDPSEASNSLDSVHPSLARNSNWFPSGTSFGGSTLSRQPSIRRPVRSRTVDFNDFAARRRSTFRNVALESDDPRSAEDIPNTLGSWVSGPISEEPLGSPGARRFFPFSRRRHDVATPSMPAWYDNGASASGPVSPPEPISSRPWRSNSGPPPLISTSSFEEHERSLSDEPERPHLPRLRRGGLRAPESMLSRHASPVNNGTDHSPPSIVISIARGAHTVTTPAAEAAEVPALTMTPGSAEQS